MEPSSASDTTTAGLLLGAQIMVPHSNSETEDNGCDKSDIENCIGLETTVPLIKSIF